MEINEFDQLIRIAETRQSAIDMLKVLQVYFLQNVEFDHIIGIAVDIQETQTPCQTKFSSQEEKEKEILDFESLFGENFHFTEKDRGSLLNMFGEQVEPSRVQKKFGEQIVYINTPGYDGGIYDCIRRLSTSRVPSYQNGLITSGVCANFASFVQLFCERLGIKCEIARTSDNHVFNLIQIDGQEKVFDFTRMIAIRDNYKNPNNSQSPNDWFDMSLGKMFEYKPQRQINSIDGREKLPEPISILNYGNYSEQQEHNPKFK